MVVVVKFGGAGELVYRLEPEISWTEGTLVVMQTRITENRGS